VGLRVLFWSAFRRGSDGPIYDAADGQRFIILASDNVEAPDTIDVILNWPSLLRKTDAGARDDQNVSPL